MATINEFKSGLYELIRQSCDIGIGERLVQLIEKGIIENLKDYQCTLCEPISPIFVHSVWIWLSIEWPRPEDLKSENGFSVINFDCSHFDYSYCWNRITAYIEDVIQNNGKLPILPNGLLSPLLKYSQSSQNPMINSFGYNTPYPNDSGLSSQPQSISSLSLEYRMSLRSLSNISPYTSPYTSPYVSPTKKKEDYQSPPKRIRLDSPQGSVHTPSPVKYSSPYSPGTPEYTRMAERLYALVIQTPKRTPKRIELDNRQLQFIQEELIKVFFLQVGLWDISENIDEDLLKEIKQAKKNLFYSSDLNPVYSALPLQAQWERAIELHQYGQFSIHKEKLAKIIIKTLLELKHNPCLILFEVIKEYLQEEGIMVLKMEPLLSDGYFSVQLLYSNENYFSYTVGLYIAITELLDNNNISHQSINSINPPIAIKIIVRISISLKNNPTIEITVIPITCTMETTSRYPVLSPVIQKICRSEMASNDSIRRVIFKCENNYKVIDCFECPILLPITVKNLIPDYTSALLQFALNHPLDGKLKDEFDKSLSSDLHRAVTISTAEPLPDICARGNHYDFATRLNAFTQYCLKYCSPQVIPEILLLIPQSGLNPWFFYKTCLISYLHEKKDIIFFASSHDTKALRLQKNSNDHYSLICKDNFRTLLFQDGTGISGENGPVLMYLRGIINLATQNKDWYESFQCYLDPYAVAFLKKHNKLNALYEAIDEINQNIFTPPNCRFLYQVAYKQHYEWPFYGVVVNEADFGIAAGSSFTLLGIEKTVDDIYSDIRSVLGKESLVERQTRIKTKLRHFFDIAGRSSYFLQIKNLLINWIVDAAKRSVESNSLINKLPTGSIKSLLFRFYNDVNRLSDRSDKTAINGIANCLSGILHAELQTAPPALFAELTESLLQSDIRNPERLLFLQYLALLQGNCMYCLQERPADLTHPKPWLELIWNQEKLVRDLTPVCLLLDQEGKHFDRLKII